MTTTWTRRVAGTLTTLGLTVGLLLTGASPAAATPDDSSALVFVPYRGQTFTIWRNGTIAQPAYGTTEQVIEGNFGGLPGRDLFLYNPGPAPDGILQVSAAPGGGVTHTRRSESVGGTYTPVVGDFDGNAIDDILWYAPGTAPDSLWLFKADGSHATKALTINGHYRPTAININADGYSDIIWYAPGTAPDSVWTFKAGAGYAARPLTINGTGYQLIPGHFSTVAEGSPQRRLIFWNPAGPDAIWTFAPNGSHTSANLPNIDGAFQPVVGRFMDPTRDAVLFYRPGTAGERFISFNADGSLNQLEPPVVNGTYQAEVGDYNGDGFDDIAWAANGRATLWKFNGGGYTQQNIVTNTVNTQVATVDNFDSSA